LKAHKEPIDTTVKLWDILYKVRMPYLQSRSTEDMRKYGVRLSSNDMLNQSISDEWITTLISVSQMVDYFGEGVPIQVVNSSEIKTIYQDLTDHLLQWKSILEKGINIGDAPMDDLILMDEFASTLFSFARYEYTDSMSDSILIRQLGGQGQFTAASLFKPIDDTNIARINADDPDEDDSALPKRDGLSSFFKDRLVTINSRRR